MTSKLLSSSEILWFRLIIVPITCTPTVLGCYPTQHSFYTIFAIAFLIHLLFRHLWLWAVSVVSWSWCIPFYISCHFSIKLSANVIVYSDSFGNLWMYPFVYFFRTMNRIQAIFLFLIILISTVSSESYCPSLRRRDQFSAGFGKACAATGWCFDLLRCPRRCWCFVGDGRGKCS